MSTGNGKKNKQQPAAERVFVRPGYVCISSKPVLLYAVTGSGVVVTLWDVKRKVGGISYFITCTELPQEKNSSFFAAPAIFSLISELQKEGTEIKDLEASVYGGAENRNARGYVPSLGEKNVDAALTILRDRSIEITGQETGGTKGRKIVFNTETGEIIVAKVSSIRERDWYPEM